MQSILKYSLIITINFMVSLMAVAQLKPAIDMSDFKKWPHINNVKISNDGKYSMYTVSSAEDPKAQLTLLSNHSGRKMVVSDVINSEMAFSPDDNFAFFLKRNDSLCTVRLNDFHINYHSGITHFELVGNAKQQLLIYFKSKNNTIVLTDMNFGKETEISDVVNYKCSSDGSNVLIIKKEQGGLSQSIMLFDVRHNSLLSIWTGEKITGATFDNSCGQIAFIGNNRLIGQGIFLYVIGAPRASPIMAINSFPTGYVLENSGNLSFTKNGERLILTFKQNIRPTNDVQSYQNLILWNYQEKDFPSGSDEVDIYGSLSVKEHTLVLLNSNGEELPFEDILTNSNNTPLNKEVIFSWNHNGVNSYQPDLRRDYKIVSTGTGKSTPIGQNKHWMSIAFSPDNKFAVWFDTDSLHWYSYEIATSKIRNISNLVPYALYDTQGVKVGWRKVSFNIAAWDTSDQSIWLYDDFDVWCIDLNGLKNPVCLTRGIGRKEDCFFGVMTFDNQPLDVSSYKEKNFWLTAYNRTTKQNGFWSLDSRLKSSPQKLNMADCFYYVARKGNASGSVEYPTNFIPLKAKNSDEFIFTRRTVSDFPNLLVTADFKSFEKISDLHPEQKYNWQKSQLIHWKMEDGQTSTGLLYKPENFDSTKKYPLIFDYYEKRSDQFHDYIYPDFSKNRINIPYYVSNGYLVFVPDVNYKQGQNGESILTTVKSAVNYLSKFPWLDSTKLGLQGHSFGGWETNFLITHSTCFAAACEASGVSDQISAYNQIAAGSGTDRREFYENFSQGSPYGNGVTPWTATGLYAKNSPVLDVGNVTTPLLMMHGDRDSSVPFDQAIEMFLALQRAEKKVWLLQYKNAYHSLGGSDMRDFTVRMKQFFDHYLKVAAAPVWMTRYGPE